MSKVAVKVSRRRYPKRQNTRRAVILFMFLLFPVLLNYLSPYVIIDGAFRGIVNGSLIVFAVMFLLSLFTGRLWCAWVCPAAGMMEACFLANNKPVRGGRLNWIKWGIWIVWVGVIIFAVISAGGYTRIDVFHLTDNIVSVDEPSKYFIYYIVVFTIFLLSLTAGRRAFCHYGCWMAPFMILGRKVRNAVNTPALRLVVEPDQCISCGKCTNACPMSLDVKAMVTKGSLENAECILCGSCVDACPKQVIHYEFSRGK